MANITSFNNLSADLYKLLDDHQFSDITLVIDQQKIYAHKIILSARSPVFAAMFNSDLEESKTNVVNIVEFSYDAVEAMIRFIYTGVVTADKLKLVANELFRLADKYDLADLKVICEKELIVALNVASAAELLILANLYGAKNLKEKSLDFIVTNEGVCNSDGWGNLTNHPQLMTEAFKRLFSRFTTHRRYGY